ncbi:MAG: hypothetical protein Q7R65_01450 [bacterium]|nr:hypothetical protein [bacterium]
MIKNFDISSGIVVAKVASITCTEYFFVQNGEPEQIFCHRNQGGTLKVSRHGRMFLSQNQHQPVSLPHINEEIVLIRESSNRSERAFTKAHRWATMSDWREVEWAKNANRIYRAIAYDHRNGGHFQKNSSEGVVLVSGTLLSIIDQFPRLGIAKSDPLLSGYSVHLRAVTLSYKVRWEYSDSDGTVVECADPRPPTC